MTGRYKAYAEYKDSGVEWVGSIPTHWGLKKLKYLAPLIGEKATEKTNPIALEHIQSWTGKLISSDSTFEGDGTKFKAGDILFGKLRPYLAKVYLTKADGEAIGDFHVMRPISNSYGKFLKSLMLTKDYIATVDASTYGAKMPRASWDFTSNIQLPFCSEVEAEKIANFLDHETSKIDTLIDKQEKLIELLKEKRQAVISHAVTKGLNPDVPMKDSGVEWLGDVPEHWEVLPTKRFFRLVAEPSTKNHGMELLSVYAAIGVAPRKDLEQKGNKASNTDGYWSVKKGDIIVNKLLAWMGAVGYSDYDGVTSPAYDILRKTKDINPKFYHFLFRQEFTQSEFKRWSRGIMEMRLRLYFEELGRIMMPVPPKNEQDKIVAEIESMNATFVKIEDKATKQIELMKERKTALISAAVTGKIDVRDWQESA
ncbi:TPA: restriction endonuclease subunit S [Vibrio parahaemolyticus]|uniref:restriction endonuclease subunit S n=1 Tax=Vibrio parahaemolyticus TaxID=670 RepID=UPI001B81B7AE|nr:restriction endonuclease subunit S [Vibrio parahaemolyticus]EHA6973990.1 restriction endonuclease subunit S [Vibrio parahaemolyticus]EHR5319355.1 restriction endonuclease subunit S [Vibrio parahaemolyticus]EJE4180832.1 restriction endonuclease subunit S [Vibrio parahaemolyticus]ELZ7230456.1 restriction endonuclease subunit S [Vibrio parahaemolyticus]